MEVSAPNRRRYRFNAKKLGITLVAFGCIAVLIALSVQHFGTQPSSAYAGSAPQSTPTADLGVLTDKCIVIDAGHGGFDPGAIGASGVREDELNLKVAKLLEKALEDQGADVIMTRSADDAIAETKDEDMAERRRIIEQSESDIVISIHMNSHTDSSISGPLVLFMPGSDNGKRLAEDMMDCINEALNADGSARGEDLYVLKSGNQPCVLVECGYISNAMEEASLSREDYQKKIAEAILQGTAAFFN
jgi:N-acetylmuramoyl-L-alanine amidase